MLFNSPTYFIFFSTVFIAYWFIFPKTLQLQNTFLVLASYVFYGWWNWKFLSLLILITITNFLYGKAVVSSEARKAKTFLLLSLVNNLAVLFIFKYYNFFIGSFVDAFHCIGINVNISLLNIALPVGISFYTFHGMSYVFDVYRKVRNPVKRFEDFALFVSFFPLLVAGPIERANHLLPQIEVPRCFNYRQSVEGLRLILWGLFKKVVIADNLSNIADSIFSSYQSYNGFSLIMGAIAFSFQIYADFSGYSDIAIGSAKLLGFELLTNFNFPYFSRTISEFWRRWHISLSTWFRDYLYIPLGGNRKGKARTILNVFIVFIISGFWHGASWNFIFWGAFHAVLFISHVIFVQPHPATIPFLRNNRVLHTIRDLLQMIRTFILVTISWIFFRLPSIADGFTYTRITIEDSFNNPQQFLSLPYGKSALLYITPLIVLDFYFRANPRLLKVPFLPTSVRWIIYLVFILLIISNLSSRQSFIYFEF